MAFKTVLNRQNRLGTYQSGSFNGAKIPASVTGVTVRALMLTGTMTNPALSMDFSAWTSANNGVTWEYDTGGHWVGGNNPGKDGQNHPPQIRYYGESLDNVRDKLVRFQMDIPTQMSVGAEAEILTV